MRTVLVQVFLSEEQADYIIKQTGSEGQTLGTQNRNIGSFLRGFCSAAIEKILGDLGVGPALPQTPPKEVVANNVQQKTLHHRKRHDMTNPPGGTP